MVLIRDFESSPIPIADVFALVNRIDPARPSIKFTGAESRGGRVAIYTCENFNGWNARLLIGGEIRDVALCGPAPKSVVELLAAGWIGVDAKRAKAFLS